MNTQKNNYSFCYGYHVETKEPVLFNREMAKNSRGFVFGTDSLAVKQEIMDVLCSTKDTVFVMDTDGTYTKMAEMLGGEIIHIPVGEEPQINLMDINLDYEFEEDAVIHKSEFMTTLFETLSGRNSGLSASQCAILDRCVKKAYEPLLASKNPETGKYDYTMTPNLMNLWEILKAQSGYDAYEIAELLKKYLNGAFHAFAHSTNFKPSKRFVVFHIEHCNAVVSSALMLCVLECICNYLRQMRGEGKADDIWLYVQNVTNLFQTESSAYFFDHFMKRSRIYGVNPTGMISSSVDFAEHSVLKRILDNTDFYILEENNTVLNELLHIPAEMQKYLNCGKTLIYRDDHFVPATLKLI